MSHPFRTCIFAVVVFLQLAYVDHGSSCLIGQSVNVNETNQGIAHSNAVKDIFAVIWEMPESHVVVTTLDETGSPVNPAADVIVCEQGKAGNCLDQDNAPHPLLTGVNEKLFDEPTFKTFIALLDNYTAAEGKPELTFNDTGDHWQEVNAFLDAVWKTKTMQVAVNHVRKELAPGTSTTEIREQVKRMWFEPYTNRYRDDQPYCVGFEHVFVGEDESNASGAPNCEDRVGGYHSWIKFYLEQKLNKVNYLGYDYPEGNIQDALEDFKVTTMVMRWSPTPEEDGGYGHDLLKKPGGFFVGTRPELEIAYGMLAWYSQRAGKYDNVPGKENHHRVKLGAHYFDLVMHPETVARAQRGAPPVRGDHIRTLYPKFRGKVVPGEKLMRFADLPTQPHNDAAIQIVAALPNPSTEDDVGEWVEIRNNSGATIELAGWTLKDQLGRHLRLSGELAKGENKRFTLNRKTPDSMMLKNGTAWILLFQGRIRRAAVRYRNPASDQIIHFDVK